MKTYIITTYNGDGTEEKEEFSDFEEFVIQVLNHLSLRIDYRIEVVKEGEGAPCKDCGKPVPAQWDYPHCPKCLEVRMGKSENGAAQRSD